MARVLDRPMRAHGIDTLSCIPVLHVFTVASHHEQIGETVQINGKVRARLTVRAGATDDELRDLALADGVVRSHTTGKTIRKVVVAKGPRERAGPRAADRYETVCSRLRPRTSV